MTLDDELEIACLVNTSTNCRGLELLKIAAAACREERETTKSLKEWIKVLERQIKRMEGG